ncbi:MAG TPA: ABC transporter permease, partial [bacterium]|nr:ABC transporter permease [bacterium]
MLEFIIRRLLLFIPLLFIVSIVSFIIIQLPPGDYLTSYIMQLRASGTEVSEETINSLIQLYGLDKPVYEQYFIWMKNIILRGDLGRSLQWNKPVKEVIGERLALTVVISLLTICVTWIIAIPIGIYSATHQYTISDYFFTFIGFIGISIPGFLLALVILYILHTHGYNITGLFSQGFVEAPWSIFKIIDMLKHIWLPILIIGFSGTGGLIRVMRATLLDELRKQYVITARAKGVPERRLLFKYPVRLALN